jgi:hypothetical protein
MFNSFKGNGLREFAIDTNKSKRVPTIYLIWYIYIYVCYVKGKNEMSSK